MRSSGVRTLAMITTTLFAGTAGAFAQVTATDSGGSEAVPGHVAFRASDGSSSHIEKGGTPGPDGSLSFVPAAGSFRLTFVMDDAWGCISFHAIEHHLRGDTITVSAFDNAPRICPGIYSPEPFTISVAGLPPKRYWLRVNLEPRGSRRRERTVPLLRMQALLR